MARALNAKELLQKIFHILEFTGAWKDSFGEPEKNFTMIIYGKSGNGKTEFAIMLAKYLTRFGKVLYNSFEQGFSKSLQDAIRRQRMDEVSSNFLVTHKEPYDTMVARLKKKKSPKIVFIDSIQYIRLTISQWHELRNMFPGKVFVMIAHAKGDEPEGFHAQKIEFDVDIKVLVKGYQAHPKSRFGGNEPYMIWDDGHRRWLARQKNRSVQPKEQAPSPQLTLIPKDNEQQKEAV